MSDQPELQPIELPSSVQLEMKKDGKVIPIMSLADLREKIATEMALKSREEARAKKEADAKAAAAAKAAKGTR